MIFLGGWEAALAVCEGNNPLGIKCLVETRDGRSEQQDRNGNHHVMMPPAGVHHFKVPASRLARPLLPGALQRGYGPCFRALAVPGTRMLVHCKNGRHRSAQVVAAILFGILGGPAEYVLNYLILRRSVVQFHALAGPRPLASHLFGLPSFFCGHESHSALVCCMFVATSLTMNWCIAFSWQRVPR
jgi:hypothetical protein